MVCIWCAYGAHIVCLHVDTVTMSMSNLQELEDRSAMETLVLNALRDGNRHNTRRGQRQPARGGGAACTHNQESDIESGITCGAYQEPSPIIQMPFKGPVDSTSRKPYTYEDARGRRCE